MTDLLARLERYYDTVPRAAATTEEIGPFTLFLRRDPAGWPYYARPRLGYDGPVTVADVAAVRARQREVGAPEAFEWVHQTTPALAEVVRAAGLVVHEHPLMVLGGAGVSGTGVRTRLVTADDPDLALVQAVVAAGFEESDEVGELREVDHVAEALAKGRVRLVAAYDEQGDVVGGGSHSPRDGVTELMGIAVLPRARGRGVGAALTAALVADAEAQGVGTAFLSASDDRVAAIYARVGFVGVGTACIAEADA